MDKTKILEETLAGLIGIDIPVSEKKAVSADKNNPLKIESSA